MGQILVQLTQAGGKCFTHYVLTHTNLFIVFGLKNNCHCKEFIIVTYL